MDPQLVARDLQRSREKLRAVMLPEQDRAAAADVFPRSTTMRFLLDSQKRGLATMLLGGLASVILGRSNRRRRRASSGRSSGLVRTLGALLGSALRR